MTAKKTLRQHDAEQIRRGLADVYRGLARIERAWGLWADDVRADAEARQGVAAGADLDYDPEYERALDMREMTERAEQAARDIGACLAETEAMNEAIKQATRTAEPEAGQ